MMASLLDWFRSGIPVVAVPRMHGAKRAVSDGREIWCSMAIWDLCVRDNDEQSMADADRVEVVVVENLKKDFRAAF